MLAWSFGGSLFEVALTCFTLPVCLFTRVVICIFKQAQNWLHQELMIVWTIGKLFGLVLACLFSPALKCLHWMVWIISCIQIRFRSCIAVFFPRWRVNKHRRNKKRKSDIGVGTLRGHSRRSCRAIVFPAVFIAGARRRLARFLKRKLATQGTHMFHSFCMQHTAFTFARPEKQKTIRNRRQKLKRKNMRKHNALSIAKHCSTDTTAATQGTAHCSSRLKPETTNPRLCGGGRGGAKNDKTQNSTGIDLLAGLQQLLQAQKIPDQTGRDSTRDASLLQALKSLVTQAQQKPSFDLWDGLTQLIAKETRRRQEAKDMKQQNTHKGKGRNTQNWRSDTHWHQDKASKQNTQPHSSGWETVKWKPRSTDWQSTLTDKIMVVDNAHALAQALEDPLNSDSAFVCIADSTEQYEEMVALALGERNAMITILAQNSVHIPDTDNIHTVKVPGTLRHGLQIRTCWLNSFGQGSPELRTKKFVEVPKIQQAGNSFDSRFPPRAKGPSWVLRLIAPGHYQQVDWDQWNSMVRAPGAAARTWATEMVGRENAGQLGDTFRFQLQNKTDLKGLFRIQQHDCALALLKASGAKAENGQRWYVEQVAGEFNGLPPAVHWLDATENERWDAYATRARRMAQNGVITGRHQLGIRVAADDSRLQEKTTVWRVDQVPKGWQFEEVLALLEEVHFTEIEVMEKQWRRTCSSWLIRAKYPGNDVILQPVVTASDGSCVELSITKEARRRQLQAKSDRLKQETRVSYGKQLQHTSSIKRTETPAHSLFDSHPGSNDVRMESDRTKRQKLEGAAPKSAAENPYKEDLHAPKYVGWMPKQAVRVPNDGKGDCLFIAVQQALSVLEPEKKRTFKQIRAFTAAYMAQHSEEYEALWDGRGPGGKEEDDDSWGTTFQDYLQGMRMAGCWGTYLECFALARGLHRDLLILTEDGEVLNFEHNCTEPAICLYFSEKAGHHEYFQGPVEAELRQWATQHQGRGGAKVHGGGCARSVRLSDFASKSSKTTANKGRPQRKTGSSKSNSKRSVRLSDFASENFSTTEKPKSIHSKCKTAKSTSK